MLTLSRSLARIARWKAQTAVEERHAADLINLALRDCEAQFRTAKSALAGLLVRQRGEEDHLARLERDVADMTERTRTAIANGQDALAKTGAEAVADLENQVEARRDTIAALDAKIAKTRRLVEGTNRRLLALRQAGTAAKADAAARLAGRAYADTGAADAFEAAESLIARLGAAPDAAEHAEAMAEIEDGLGPNAARDAMAAAGIGAARRQTSAGVLERLRAEAADAANTKTED